MNRVQIKLSDDDLQRLTLARIVARRMTGQATMPSQSEAIAWLLHSAPLEAMMQDDNKPRRKRKEKPPCHQEDADQSAVSTP